MKKSAKSTSRRTGSDGKGPDKFENRSWSVLGAYKWKSVFCELSATRQIAIGSASSRAEVPDLPVDGWLTANLDMNPAAVILCGP